MKIVGAVCVVLSSTAALAAPPSSPPPPPPTAIPLPPPVMAIKAVQQPAAGGPMVAQILLMNVLEDTPITPPERLEATLHTGGRDLPVTLERQGAAGPIAAKGWAEADYAVAMPAGVTGEAVLSLDGGRQGYAFALPAAATGGTELAAVTPAAAPTRAPGTNEPPPNGEPAREGGPSVLANLSTYRPVYALLGRNTDSDLLIQLSFQYQLFGHPDDANPSWLNGFHLGFTQQIFWDIGADSQPFRDESFQPELFYRYVFPTRSNGVRFSAQGGFLHESNGKGGADSRGYQIVYIQPQADLPVGGYTLSVGPRLFSYVFSRDNNTDIARYRGHQSLALSFGEENGLKIATTSRYNFSHGKGSFEGELSYPVRRLIGATPLYLVVQGFTGYGEDLLDYNRHQTRLRIGIGIVR